MFQGMSLDTVVGMGMGALVVAFLWTRSGAAADEASVLRRANNAAQKKKRIERDFQLSDIALYDGKDGRLMYIALPEPDDGVYDVTSKLSEYADCGGRELPGDRDADKVKAEFQRVGRLVRPREYTADELYQLDGREGRPLFLAAKGEVFDVSRGADFYGPEGGYALMAGRDASRALALVSLDQKDMDNNRIDDLSASDIMTLDEWRFKFYSKYTMMGTLKGWTPAGSPLPTVLAARLGAEGAVPPTPAPKAATASNTPKFLTKERQRVQLKERQELSPDTTLFRFALPKPDMILGLPIGKHIKFWCPNPKPKVPGQWNGREDPEAGKEEIERKYTPSSLDSEAAGQFDVIIKVYRPNDKFCDGGKMSQHFGNLKVGDWVDVAGPFGLNEKKGRGEFQIGKRTVMAKMIGMMAGGTGVTPMLQLIKATLRDPDDDTKLSLIFANQTEADILVRDMLEDLQRKNPKRFKIHYTLDRPPENWEYSSGFITAEMIKAHLPPPGAGTFVFMCGPPPMVKFACKGNLEKLGYAADQMAEF